MLTLVLPEQYYRAYITRQIAFGELQEDNGRTLMWMPIMSVPKAHILYLLNIPKATIPRYVLVDQKKWYFISDEKELIELPCQPFRIVRGD